MDSIRPGRLEIDERSSVTFKPEVARGIQGGGGSLTVGWVVQKSAAVR